MSNNAIAILTQVRESLERAGVHDGRHGGDLPGQEQRVQVPQLYSTVQYSTVQYSTPVQYRSLTCLGGDYDQFAKFFAKLMRQFSWRHVTFVYHQVAA